MLFLQGSGRQENPSLSLMMLSCGGYLDMTFVFVPFPLALPRAFVVLNSFMPMVDTKVAEILA
jgi:hypothetical protein